MSLKKTMDELERKSPEAMQTAEKHPIVVVLDDVRSMHNVGSAFRTSDAFAIEMICLCGYTPQPPHRDIHKTALGSTETVKWKHYPTATDAVTELKAQGYKIYSAEQAHNSIPLQQVAWNGEKAAIVFGNEVTGVNDEVLAQSDKCIEIPQWGAKHSLNISVCVGIVLWEMIKPKQ